jgi:hypothetical protein
MLFSSNGSISTFGRAHPNTLTSGILWGLALKRRFGLPTWPNADLTSLDQPCARPSMPPSARGCPRAPRSRSAHRPVRRARAPPTPPLSSPREPRAARPRPHLLHRGPSGRTYAEGGYETPSVTGFRSLLAIAYADDFAGQLLKAGDVTPVLAPAAAPETI